MIISEQEVLIDTNAVYDKFIESAGVAYNKEIVNNNLTVPLTILAVLFLLSKA